MLRREEGCVGIKQNRAGAWGTLCEPGRNYFHVRRRDDVGMTSVWRRDDDVLYKVLPFHHWTFHEQVCIFRNLIPWTSQRGVSKAFHPTIDSDVNSLYSQGETFYSLLRNWSPPFRLHRSKDRGLRPHPRISGLWITFYIPFPLKVETAMFLLLPYNVFIWGT